MCGTLCQLIVLLCSVPAVCAAADCADCWWLPSVFQEVACAWWFADDDCARVKRVQRGIWIADAGMAVAAGLAHGWYVMRCQVHACRWMSSSADSHACLLADPRKPPVIASCCHHITSLRMLLVIIPPRASVGRFLKHPDARHMCSIADAASAPL